MKLTTEKQEAIMREVRNSADKLVCRIDKDKHIVEIVTKGIKTTIRFSEDGMVEITNTAA